MLNTIINILYRELKTPCSINYLAKKTGYSYQTVRLWLRALIIIDIVEKTSYKHVVKKRLFVFKNKNITEEEFKKAIDKISIR